MNAGTDLTPPGDADRATVSSDTIRSAIGPLRLIFWAGLIYAVDVPFGRVDGGQGWRFDLLNDAVAMLLIAVGVFRLGRLRVDPPWLDRYGSAMKFVKAIALLGIADAVGGHFVFRRSPELELIVAVFRLAQAGAGTVFFLCMRSLCAKAGLKGAARGWSVSLGLFLVVVAGPVGSYFYAAFLHIMAGGTAVGEVGLLRIVAKALLVVPFAGAYVSTSRMAQAVGRGGSPSGPMPSAGEPGGRHDSR